ncbi:MAG TPA: lipase maturation factor family protein [Balneolales bacterium]|nr:lipase maturation factor family protein [Balneolales bacterium]
MLAQLYHSNYWISRLIIERAMGIVYLIAFTVALNQFRPLVGEKGLLPATIFIKKIPFRRSPSLFQWYYSDYLLRLVAWTGIFLSIILITGLLDDVPIWTYMSAWFLLWVFYLSIVNVGQIFYGYGWESLLLESGFYTIFLGPLNMATSVLVIWILRWLVFRVEFGAGLIKMRGDRCWRELTCMNYHHETQPFPNPLSRYFHHVPSPLHRFETFSNHVVQLFIVWGLFAPQPIASIAAILIICSQLYLIISGNYAWLNWLTVILALSGFSDKFLQHLIPLNVPTVYAITLPYQALIYLLTIIVAYMSIGPIKNMISRNQAMNRSFNPLHLVNTYGAFGSVTRERYEIIIEGTNDENVDKKTEWKAYEFKGKPGDTRRRSSQVAPYHLRIDWQMWFAALEPSHRPTWFYRFVLRLLQNDKQTLKLIRYNPFGDDAPRFIRARLFLYRYSTSRERKENGQWWNRTYLQDYLRPVSLKDFENFLYYF